MEAGNTLLVCLGTVTFTHNTEYQGRRGETDDCKGPVGGILARSLGSSW